MGIEESPKISFPDCDPVFPMIAISSSLAARVTMASALWVPLRGSVLDS